MTDQTQAPPPKPLVGPDGRPARRVADNRCPRCKAGPEHRVNTAGFGDPVICCNKCGHHYEGATEC